MKINHTMNVPFPLTLGDLFKMTSVPTDAKITTYMTTVGSYDYERNVVGGLKLDWSTDV